MTFIVFIVVIGIVIFVHELGHFLVAKCAGVYVGTFSLGFGPRLLGIRIGETDYRISAIPLGGYVSMAGQADLPDEQHDETHAHVPAYRRYDTQPVLTRMAIIVAGPLMNILFALPIAIVMLMSGIQQPLDIDQTTIGDVVPGSPAAVAGLVPGDRIIAVAQQPVDSWQELVHALTTRIGDATPITYLRKAQTNFATVVPELNPEKGYMGIGVMHMKRAQVAAILPDSPAARAGIMTNDIVYRVVGLYANELSMDAVINALQARPERRVVLGIKRFPPVRYFHETNQFTRERIVVETTRASTIAHAQLYGSYLFPMVSAPTNFPVQNGDIIRAIDGTPLAVETAQDVIATMPEGPVDLTIERVIGGIAKEVIQTNITVDLISVGRIGVVFAPAQQTVRYTFTDALKQSPTIVLARVKETIHVIRMLFQRKVGLQSLTGPIGIARLTGAAAAHGRDVLLGLVLLITVNLGILNLLPIPVLDGGHVILLLGEAVYRKPLPTRLVLWYQKLGILLILTLTVFVFYNDIVNWLADSTAVSLLLGAIRRFFSP